MNEIFLSPYIIDRTYLTYSNNFYLPWDHVALKRHFTPRPTTMFHFKSVWTNGIVKTRPIEETERVKQTKEHVKKVSAYIEKFQFNLGAEAIREFFWHQICDVWIEDIKEEIKEEPIGSDKRKEKLSELLFILKENLKIMHPFIPFVTEGVWQELVKLGLANGLLMVQQLS